MVSGKREGVIVMPRYLAQVLTMMVEIREEDQFWGKSSGLDVINVRACGMFRNGHEAFGFLDLKLRRQRFCWKQRFGHHYLRVINVL